MGAWSTSINGNDTALDLKLEYMAVFASVSPEQGIVMLDEYIRTKWLEGEADEEIWTDYTYSLADFLWNHGILTQEVKDRVLDMIRRKSDMARWQEAGMESRRERVLNVFAQKLVSPQPQKKIPRIRVNRNPVFRAGDVVAIQLCTAQTVYYSSKYLTPEELKEHNGHWILIHKLYDQVSWNSELIPEIRDIWPVFELGQHCFSEIPKVGDWLLEHPVGVFFGNGTIGPYQRRGAQVIENCPIGLECDQSAVHGLFFSNMRDQDFLIAQKKGTI